MRENFVSLMIFANSATELQEKLTELTARGKEVGLQINPSKTKVMTNDMETPIILEAHK